MATKTVTAFVSGLGVAAALALAVPTNSVGSAQIKDGSVASIDIKNSTVTSKDIKNATVASIDIKDGSVTGTDLAPGTVPAPVQLEHTENYMNCAGWCYLPNSSTYLPISSFASAPANTGSWTSTQPGDFETTTPMTVQITATVTVFFFDSNADAICAIRDNGAAIAGSLWIRGANNESQVITIIDQVDFAPGSHLITLSCRGNGSNTSAAQNGAINLVMLPA